MTGSPSRSGLVGGALLVAAIAGALGGIGLEDERYNADESRWMDQAGTAWEKFRTGAWDDPYWQHGGMLWGFPSPPVAKYLMGIGMAAAGERWEHSGEQPPPDVLRAGRLSSVVLGAIGAAVFFLMARSLLPFGAALGAALLLASGSIWLPASRRAMVDVHGAALALSGIALFALARARALRGGGGAGAVLQFGAAGLLFGLAAGAKMNSAGFAAGCGVLLLVDLARTAAAGGPGRARTIAAGGALLAVVAAVAFVGTNPFLHDDPIGGFQRIRGAWGDVIAARTADPRGFYAAAYPPGVRSLQGVWETFLVPAPPAAALLLLPCAGVAAAWGAGRRRLPSDRVRPMIWTLMVPALVAALFAGGPVTHVWLVWAGLVAGLLNLAAPGGPRGTGSPVVLPLAVATAGSLVVIGSTVYVTWTRYYLPLVPAVVLLASWELHRLREWVRARAGEAAGALVLVSVALAVASVLGAYPDYGLSKLGRLRLAGWGSVLGVLTAGSALSLFAAIGWGWLGGSARGTGGKGD